MQKSLPLFCAMIIFFFACEKKPAGASVDALTPEEKALSAAIGKVLGEGRFAAVFEKLKQGMKCEEVAQVFSGLKCNTSEEHSLVSVPVKDNAAIDAYSFFFDKNKLTTGALVFKPILSREALQKIAMPIFVAKWGKGNGGEDGNHAWADSDLNITTLSPDFSGKFFKLDVPLSK